MLEEIAVERGEQSTALIELALRFRVEGHLFHSLPLNPAPNSPFVESDALYPWEKSSDWCREYLSAALESALLWADFHAPLAYAADHRVLIRPRPIQGLARSSLESASQAVWVMVADQPEELALRHLRLVRDDQQEQRRALALRGADKEAAAALVRFDERLQGRFDGRAVRDKATYLTCIRAAAAAIGDSPDQYEYLWRQASGATHGKRWAILAINDVQAIEEYEPGQLRVHRTARLDALSDVLATAYRTVHFGVAVYCARSGFDVSAARVDAIRAVAQEIPVAPEREHERQQVLDKLSE